MWRQEDAHEYMRYLIEALQKCCPKEVSSGASPSNYIQRVFGGRLRSQVLHQAQPYVLCSLVGQVRDE